MEPMLTTDDCFAWGKSLHEKDAGRLALWQRFIEFCATLRYGEIEKLKIQDGIPVMAEVITKKVKFS